MAQAPNMKIGIGADTSDFDKGAKAVKQGLKDLDKTGNDALSSLGAAFGVNTGKIGQMTSALKGVGQKLTECGNEGVKAFGALLKSIGPVGGAIAGLGIGAATIAFRELKKEAEDFKNTVQGANIEMATAAYVETYKQILRDFDGDFGKALATTESTWKKTWTQIGQSVKQLFRTGAFGEMVSNTQGQATEEYYRRLSAANEGAQKAEKLTNDIYKLERQRKEQAVELAKINDQIATAQQNARDASKTTAARSAAIAEWERLVAEKKTMTVTLEQDLAKLYKERSSLASDSVQAADATLAQEMRVYETSRAITQEETAILKVKNSIGKATAAEIARYNKLLEQQKALQAEIDATRAKWAEMASTKLTAPSISTPGVTAPTLSIVPRKEDVDIFKSTIQMYMGDYQVSVGIKADTKQILDITNEVNSLIGSSVARTSELIGNLMGTLAGGGDGWGDFKNAALSAFGDLAIAVGKIAISSGLAVSGIEAALKSGQWYVAVAAGAALVALGSAVKSSLAAVASGDYSSAGGGYSSSSYGGGSGSDYETREVKVYVTGTLEADGDKLITVINNTTKSNYYKK